MPVSQGDHLTIQANTGYRPDPNEKSDGKSRIVPHWNYLEIAWANLEIAREIDLKIRAMKILLNEKRNTLTESELMGSLSVGASYEDRRAHAIFASMVFSAMMLEAYVNALSRCLLPRFYRENLDKLDIPAKWAIVPKLIYGQSIEPGTDLNAKIDRLQKTRNTLVHAKPIIFNFTEGGAGEKYRIGLERAESAVQTCLDVVDFIQSVDPAFNGMSLKSFSEWRNRLHGKHEHDVHFEARIQAVVANLKQTQSPL